MKIPEHLCFGVCVLNGLSAVAHWKFPAGTLVAVASLLFCAALMVGRPREFFRSRACFYSLVISLMNLIASVIIF